MRIVPPVHADEFYITLELIQHLLSSQIPSLAQCRLTPIIPGGTDHVMIRFNDCLVGRFPRHAGAVAAAQVEKTWLPWLGNKLSVPIPNVSHVGKSEHMYPAPWSILSWVPGAPANPVEPGTSPRSASRLAHELGHFVKELRSIAAPEDLSSVALPKSYRTGSLSDRDTYLVSALGECGDVFDRDVVLDAWHADISSSARHHGAPLAAHGDLQPSNIIIDPETHELTGVIDWTGLSFGDPAVDLLPAWMLFDQQSRKVFRTASGADNDMWRRGRAWALSIGIIAFPYYRQSRPDHAAVSERQVEAMLADIQAEDRA